MCMKGKLRNGGLEFTCRRREEKLVQLIKRQREVSGYVWCAGVLIG